MEQKAQKTLSQKHELFSETPVPKALMTLAVPTVISQLVTMVYNLADTFFVGKSNDPVKVAAVSVCFPLLFLMNAFSNLFGIGGGSLVARLLGQKRDSDARKVAVFSLYGSIFLGIIYVLLIAVFREPILAFLGASENTSAHCQDYVFYVILLGSIPTITGLTVSHLLRNEGFSTIASIGLTGGGILNIILDPLFMFVILPAGQEVKGAAIATLISNCAALLFFVVILLFQKEKSILSLNPRVGIPEKEQIKSIFLVGLPSAIASGLANLANMFMTHLSASYGDITLAATGIVKKIDMLPMNTGMGLCQGMIPLVAYNYASGNYKRMRQVIRTARTWGLIFAGICILCFETLAPSIVRFFILDPDTVRLGSRFLRIAVLTTPLTIVVFQTNYSFQAIGCGTYSLIISVCKQGILYIPLLYLANYLFQMDGVMGVQIAADILTLLIAFLLWRYKVEPMLRQKELKQKSEYSHKTRQQ